MSVECVEGGNRPSLMGEALPNLYFSFFSEDVISSHTGLSKSFLFRWFAKDRSTIDMLCGEYYIPMLKIIDMPCDENGNE